MCPSPAIDVTYRVDRLRVGDTVRVDDATRRPGGKAVNVARVLHGLAEPVHLLAPVGGTSGAEFARLLAEAGPIATTLVDTGVPTRTTVTVVDDEGAATVLAETATIDCWPALLEQLQRLAPLSDVVVLSGRSPAGAPLDAFGAMVRVVRAAARPVVVDTSGPALLAALGAGPTVVKPNASELRELVGAADPAAAAARLATSSGATVVLSLGVDGALATTGTRSWQARTTSVDGNPTGAGDAVVAGIARALRHDQTSADDPAAMLCDAVALGAAAVAAPTAGEVDAARYADLVARVDAAELATAR